LARVDGELKNSDLIRVGKEQSDFLDFRLKRLIIDEVKSKKIKNYTEKKILASLMRCLIFESTKMLSNEDSTKELIVYDNLMH